MTIKNNIHDQKNSEVSEEQSKSDVSNNRIDGDQRFRLTEEIDTGSKSWADVQKDKYQYDYQPSFPSWTTAKTTIYAQEASNREEKKYDKLFLLNHGRQHPAERRANGFSEEWDGEKVRQENVWKSRRAKAILSQADITDPFSKWAVQKVMQENLHGFSRHYEGIDGAALGFASLYKYDNVETAKNSYLVDKAEEMLGVDGEKLMDYVWREYGDDVR